jgi:hypothetical protein
MEAAMKVSELQINAEAMMLIVRSLAVETHNLAASRGIAHGSVDDQLPLVLGIIDSSPSYLLAIRDVPTSDTACLAAVSIRFSDKGYRLLAPAAKDRVANSADGNGNVFRHRALLGE